MLAAQNAERRRETSRETASRRSQGDERDHARRARLCVVTRRARRGLLGYGAKREKTRLSN